MTRILAIDDEITTQLLLQDLLESEGHEVLIAEDGQQGWELTLTHRPNLIVCDWMMPQIDGLELCRRIKAEPELEAVFFILLTARENLDDRVRGLDAGADDFISKPIETEELLARVRAGLRLNHLNNQLSRSLQELQAAQAQLVHSEKMSSLGRLVAGIAHEINNPISFIYGNLTYVNEYTSTLSSLVRDVAENPNFSREHFLEQLEDLDINFIVKDIKNVVSSMKDGAERIREIVVSLQEFSSNDRAGLQKIDVCHSLDLALSILEHRCRDKVSDFTLEIVKNYVELPKIEGYASSLNQVFLGLIDNAIDAVTEAAKTRGDRWQPKVLIQTCQTPDNWVEVIISDNGNGIQDRIRDKIFDPFFTTKPVGKGKGLGLSIGYQIVVQQHGGQLEYRSQPELGTQFFVRLPLKPNIVEAKPISTR
ncbi:sensor histidine kinase [Baaleninema simplex]|uniref:sensor histidine kinase n=1 Tax=Baaleninema simplex TaxID=2862350 RepID=UPI00034A7D30|nr:response regulator [Baaleninema simplex]